MRRVGESVYHPAGDIVVVNVLPPARGREDRVSFVVMQIGRFERGIGVNIDNKRLLGVTDRCSQLRNVN